MSKKILILSGSPHKEGNTNFVVQCCAESARGQGSQVECIDVSRLTLKHNGCSACMGCQQTDRYECVLSDEAAEIVKRIPEFDVLVLATPIYFFSICAQLKIILDRMFCLFRFNPETEEFIHPLGGKTLALIATAGGDENGGLNLVGQTAEAMAQFIGMKGHSLLIPHAPHEPGKINDNLEIKQKAQDFGKILAQS